MRPTPAPRPNGERGSRREDEVLISHSDILPTGTVAGRARHARLSRSSVVGRGVVGDNGGSLYPNGVEQHRHGDARAVLSGSAVHKRGSGRRRDHPGRGDQVVPALVEIGAVGTAQLSYRVGTVLSSGNAGRSSPDGAGGPSPRRRGPARTDHRLRARARFAGPPPSRPRGPPSVPGHRRRSAGAASRCAAAHRVGCSPRRPGTAGRRRPGGSTPRRWSAASDVSTQSRHGR